MKSSPNHRRKFLQLGLGATAGLITTSLGSDTRRLVMSSVTGADAHCGMTRKLHLVFFLPF